MLEQILNNIRSGQAPMRRSFRIPDLRRRVSSKLDMVQLKGQLYNMLITFQVFGASIKRTESVEGTVQDLSQRLDALEGRATLGPSSISVSPRPSRDNSGFSATSSMSGRVQHGSSTGSEALNDRNVPTGGSPLSLQGVENPVPGASNISPLAP
ncbi:hypothetical protein BDP27DRAFT_1342725 [Rhodocollybia butyracea]|uniref:Uncharacterized protein n=1 Tax=Rhodocollybia butyracea TaxID=206335 RepID=A0A9P5PAQ4_9AGAR|nr:hypothetical protein BDP27DRAFT_1342725 [Rhodocollybia butyracea]